MDKDLARRAHSLFMQALALDPTERASFLVASCADDITLKAHVERMLDALHNSNDFLQSPLHSAALSARSWMEPPDRIENYRIVRTLGVGGMATVYEAIQEQPQRRVALKVLRTGLVHGTAIERFRFETEILATLQHPGIAQIFEAGTYDGGDGTSLPFFAMEYIADASPITTYARQKQLSLEARLTLFRTVCEAVLHGHQHGVIHRDLKPGNVLVDGRGFAKVIDFGVARPSDPGAASITRDADIGQLVGTLNYMSPEQCTGEGVDIRTDVYSLGVILYELVCARLPHDLSRVPVTEALRRISTESVPRPRAVVPTLPGDVDAIVMKALDKDPEARYPTVAALGADIRRHLQCETVEARPPTMFYLASRFVRRHRLLIGSLALVLLTVVGGALVSGTLAYRTWRESLRRIKAEKQALAERDAARRQSYVASVAAANAAIQVEEYTHARTRLQQAPVEHRGWEWHVLAGIVESSNQTTQAHDDMVMSFAMAPTHTRLATGDRSGTMRVWTLPETRMLSEATVTSSGPVYAVNFDSTGEFVVASGGDGTARIWDAQTGQPTGVIAHHGYDVRGTSWANGSVVGVASIDGIGRLWDACTGEIVRVLEDQPGGVHRIIFNRDGSQFIAWGRSHDIWLRDTNGEFLRAFDFGGQMQVVQLNPDGSLLAAGGVEGRLKVWDVRRAVELFDLTDADNPSTVRSIAFSEDGTKLAAGHTTRAVMVYSLETGKRIRSFHGHAEAVSGLFFSADGDHLYSSSWDQTIRRWDLADHRRASVDLAGHTDHILGVSFSPDGSWLATSGRDRRIILWDMETYEIIRTLEGHSSTISDVRFSPAGGQLASCSYDRTIRLWDPRTGASGKTLTGHTAQVWSIAFDDEGKRLVSCGDDETIRLWDLDSGETTRVFQGHSNRVIRAVFNPDGDKIASASRDHTVRIWDSETGEVLHDLRGHTSDVFAVVFSPDGSRLFSGSRDQSVRVWDVATGHCLAVLTGHGQFITCLSLLEEGKRLAAGSWFGEIVIWDLETLEVVITFKASRHAIRALAFSSDGRRLASGDYENTIRIYDAEAAAKILTEPDR